MSNTKILNLAEYTSLGLSVLGTMVAATTGQAAFAATPLTFALSLNLFNRQELAKRTQRNKNNISHLEQEFSRDINTLSNNIDSVEDSLLTLPSSEETINLNELDKAVSENQQKTRQLLGKVNNLELSLNNLPTEQQSIDLIQIEKIIMQRVAESITSRLMSLSRQLNSLENQFNNRLERREIEEIKEKFNWLVTRKEFNPICEQVQALSSSFDSSSLEEFKTQLTRQLNALKLRLDNFPAPSEPIDLTEIERVIATIESQLVTLKPIPEQIAQFQSELILLEDLDASAADLHDYTLHIKRELENQKTQLKNQAQQLLIMPQQIEQTIQSFNQLIKENQPVHTYELISNRDGSREVLLEALRTAQERLILVCPWITQYGANHEVKRGTKGNVIELCEQFLARGGILEIGWGHLKDTQQTQHIPISRDKFLSMAQAKGNNWAYNQLEKFIELEQQYPNRMNLKLLGTHEKFLVCDRTFAMIGSHNFLTSDFNTTERELGLKTNNKDIIEDVIKRFETASCLDKLVRS